MYCTSMAYCIAVRYYLFYLGLLLAGACTVHPSHEDIVIAPFIFPID